MHCRQRCWGWQCGWGAICIVGNVAGVGLCRSDGADGNIGAAVGLHLSNNLFAFVVVGEVGGPSSGLALFLYPPTDYSQFDYGLHTLMEPWVIPEILILSLMVGVMWLAARIAIRA